MSNDARATGDASAALGERYVRPVFFAWLDIDGDPVRANTSGRTLAFAPGATGDPDLDGHEFGGISCDLVTVSPVKEQDGGSSTVTVRLSGLVGVDDALLAVIGDAAKWQGRLARLWWLIRDANDADRGAATPFYTGYMISLSITGSSREQVLELSVESYLAAFSAASNRTYLEQELFDPGDLSARAAIAIANGISGNSLIQNTPTTPGGGFDGFGNGLPRDYSQRALS